MLPLQGPTNGYVFLVTYGRSGSTLLLNLLNGLPGYCIRGENENALAPLVEAYHRLADSPNIRRRREAGEATDGWADPWYGADAIRPADFGRALADTFARNVLTLPEGTRVGGFKEIRYTMPRQPMFRQLDFMHRFFPNARFVFNTRNPAAVARSGWWRDRDPAEAIALLERADASYEAYYERRPESCIRLHYDSYVADRDRLKPLFDFLGHPWDRALVDSVMDRRLTHSGLPPREPGQAGPA